MQQCNPSMGICVAISGGQKAIASFKDGPMKTNH